MSPTSPSSLDALTGVVVARVLPAYAALGTLAWAHVQGSLVLGYTDESDLDVILVWAAAAVPTERQPIVARLDERQREVAESVDYSDIHIDRFWIGGQEYELAHYTLPRFEQIMESVLSGSALPGREIVNPEALAAAFREAVFVTDLRGQGRRLQRTLRAFPAHIAESARRAARNNCERRMNELRTHAGRGDWFPFYSALASATRTVLRAIFAARGVYWTNDKWRGAAMQRYGFESHLIDAYDRIWSPDSTLSQRLAALEELTDAALAEALERASERGRQTR